MTHSAPGALAAKQATATNPIPVVMTNVSDAVGAGIVASLARPGGNITGDTFFVPELAAKRLELLKNAIPRLRRVAVLANPDNAAMGRAHQAMAIAAKELNLELLRFDVRRPADLDGTFAAMARENGDALAVIEDIVLIQNHKTVAESAVRQRLPSISFIEYADAGGLFGYSADYLALYRRASCLRRQDSQRRQTRRHSCRATDDIRFRDQHEDRQGAWPCLAIRDPLARCPTDRMTGR